MTCVGFPKSVTIAYSELSTVKRDIFPRTTMHASAAINASLRILDHLSTSRDLPIARRSFAALAPSGGHPHPKDRAKSAPSARGLTSRVGAEHEGDRRGTRSAPETA